MLLLLLLLLFEGEGALFPGYALLLPFEDIKLCNACGFMDAMDVNASMLITFAGGTPGCLPNDGDS